MFNNLDKYHIILASNSPRRKELLAHLGIEFSVRTIEGIDESYPDGLSDEDVALHIAEKKMNAYRLSMKADELIITADTIVCVDGAILGKPADDDEAKKMLRTLSGREHKVITGVAVSTQDRTETFAATTTVRFADLTDEEIEFYVANYKPTDKAGAYGIQEWIGYIGVESISGSFFNVIGLPVQRLYKVLKKF